MSTSSKPLRLAILGAGGIAKAHVQAATELASELVISAFADVNLSAAKSMAEAHNAKAYGSSEDLFAARDRGEVAFDALVVCTPPTVRIDPIREALSRGVACLVEKPVAINGEAAAQIAELVAAHPETCFAVAYCHRFAPAIVRMKQLVSEGKIGRLTRFENCFAFFHPPKAEMWMSDPAVSGGGSFIDTGCHSLDIFRYLVGPGALVGAVYDNAWNGRGEAGATAVVRATEGPHAGTAGVILAGWLEPTRFTVKLVGTEGTLDYDYMNGGVIGFTASDDSKTEIEVESHEVRFREQLRRFAQAARDPGSRGDLATAEDALATAEMVDAAGGMAKII